MRLHLVVSDAGKGISKPGLRIDAVQFGGFDQGVGDGCGFAAGLRSGEEVVLAAQSDGAHRPFGGPRHCPRANGGQWLDCRSQGYRDRGRGEGVPSGSGA